MEMPSGDIRDMLSCPICMEELEDPKALPCLHTFCKVCIHSHIMKSFETKVGTCFTCPICRKRISGPKDVGPEGWADTFTSNHIMESLKDSFKTNTEAMCPVHAGKEAELYCYNHETVICSKCLITGHKQCHVDMIDDAVKIIKGKVTDIDKQMTGLEQHLRKKKYRRSKVQSRLCEIQQEVTDWRKDIVQMVLQWEGDMIQKAKEATDQELERLNNDIKIGKLALRNLSNAKQELSDMNQDRAVLKSSSKINAVLSEADAVTTALVSSNCPLELQFHKKNSLEKELTRIGGIGLLITKRKEVSVSQPPINQQDKRNVKELASENKAQTAQEVPTLLVRSAAMKPHVDAHFKTLNVRTGKDRNDCLIKGCAFVPGGYMVITDYNNSKVKFFNQDLQLTSEMSFTSDPWDVCYAGNDKIAVSFPDDNLVQFFKVKNGQIFGTDGNIQFAHRCYGIDIHKNSLAVSCRNREGYSVYVANMADSKITGSWKRERIASYSNGGMWYVAFNETGDILYVTNDSEDKLFTLSVGDESICEICNHSFTQTKPHGISASDTVVVVACPVGVKSMNTVQLESIRSKVILSPGSVVSMDRKTYRIFTAHSTGSDRDNWCEIYVPSFVERLITSA